MSRTYFILIIFLFCSGFVFRQIEDKALQSLIDAELEFAKTAHEENTRDAFIKHFSDSGVVFFQGEAVNAIHLWKEREVMNDLLSWRPTYADISRSKDFGYTVGPYELSMDRSDEAPSAYGHYATVWQKYGGIWKAVVDLGVGHSQPDPAGSDQVLSYNDLKSRKFKADRSKDILLKLDRDYVSENNSRKVSFNTNYFASTGRIHRPRNYPVVGIEMIKKFKETQFEFTQTAIMASVANSGDMAYTIGKCSITVNENGTTKKLNGNYLRVWKRGGSEDWKIVLDVVGL